MRRAGSRLTSSPPRRSPRLVRASVSGDSSTRTWPLPFSVTVRQTPGDGEAVADRQPVRQPGAHPHGEAHPALPRRDRVRDQPATLDDEAGEQIQVIQACGETIQVRKTGTIPRV